jgi:hypothetical protein
LLIIPEISDKLNLKKNLESSKQLSKINGNIKSNTDDNLDGILGFSITIANFVEQYHKYVACPGIEMVSSS